MNKGGIAYLAGMGLGAAITATAHDQHLTAVRPLPGYACMMLNLSNDQLRDAGSLPPVLAAPAPGAPKIGIASGIVLAKIPAQPTNGYDQVLLFNGKQGWVAAAMLRPYRSASDPHAHCTPSLMSDGRPGIG